MPWHEIRVGGIGLGSKAMTGGKRILIFLMALLFVSWGIPGSYKAAAETSFPNQNVQANSSYAASVSNKSYSEYYKEHSDAGWNGGKIVLSGKDYAAAADSEYVDNLDGKPALITGEDSIAKWDFTVDQPGLYRIELDYYTVEGTGGTIERAVYLDGVLPFSESYNINFSRRYTNEGPIVKGPNGDDIRPRQIEQPGWMTGKVGDQFGYFGDTLYYYLSKGAHSLEFRSLREPMAINEIRLISSQLTYPSYSEYLQDKVNNGAKAVKGVLDGGILMKQAEDSDFKSDPTLYPINDNTSPATIPYDTYDKKLNAIGGTGWSQRGQWLTWTFSVPESGLYRLGVRSKQNIYRDMNANRSLYIDGEIPFHEAEDIAFTFSDKWKVGTFGSKEEPYLIYLTKGTHDITLGVSLGGMRDSLMQSMQILTELNKINLQLIALMGTTPDIDRDYQIEKYMPELLEDIDTQRALLQQVRDDMVRESGESDEMIAEVDQLIFLLNEMTKKPDQIAARFDRFRGMVSSFGNWIMQAREQPLLIDYIFLAEEDAVLPKAEKGFFVNLICGIKEFFASFFKDYSLLSEDVNDAEAITVWIGNGLTGGRDQAMALSKMIVQDFSNNQGINVKLQLVPPGTILSATLAGKGPDVALQLGGGEPVNYAMRNAVYDLSEFEDFDEITARFHSEALTPFRYNDGVYALPETFSFPMMFYRQDVLYNMGISIEDIKTWNDVINLLTTLQQNNMSFGLYPDMSVYSIFLYQMGGSYYKDGGKASNLDSRTSIDAFTYWMQFYTNYGLDREFNFINRFRTGEMPIGISDYTTYNLLSVSAPEIKGQWGMTTIPGFKRKDGTINNTAPSGSSGAVIMQSAKNHDAAWEFLKWWTSADIQYTFGRELEAVMGPAARYNTANIEAMSRLPWSASNRNMLLKQMENLQGTPEVPGGYYTSRYLDFAKVAVYDRNENPKDVLLEYVDEINAEIRQKRESFGLDTE